MPKGLAYQPSKSTIIESPTVKAARLVYRGRLEVESLKSPKRIEALAMERLHLISPGQGEAIVLERVVQAEPPAQSLVARR